MPTLYARRRIAASRGQHTMRLIRLTVDIALRCGCFVALVVAYSYAEVAGGAHLPAHVAPTLALFACAALGPV